MANPFRNHEMCDGARCPFRVICARWIERCDADRCTQWVNFNLKAHETKPPCWLPAPDEHYPGKNDDATDTERLPSPSEEEDA